MVRQKMGLTKPADYITTPGNPMREIWRLGAALLALSTLFSSCSPHRFFYLPTRQLYSDPASKGIAYDVIEVPSLNGKRLSAIVFKANGTPKGTVVHCHGNFGNVSSHYMGSQYLTAYGFDVIVFDYQGYGGSQGRPSPKRTIEDGIAMVRYAQANLREPSTGVVVLGQSLGGAVASVVAAKERLVKAVVLEAPFYSYSSIARDVLRRSFITWPLYPIYPLLLGRTYNPSKWVEKISPTPVLFIHGNKDTVVPSWMSEKLYARANEPKRLWIIDGANHLECRYRKGKEYEEAIANFFSEALQK